MSQYLDSRYLRMVAEIARTESVTRAADRMHVTQSAISHQLRELESKLGTAVFVRSGRRMLPTPAGRLLLEAAGPVLDTLDQVEARVSQLARNVVGELRLAAQCHTGYHWLPPLVSQLRVKYPAFDVRIAPEYTLNPLAALLDARIDLAIMNSDTDDRRLRYHALFDDEHVVVVAPSHALAHRPFVAPKDLADHQLFLYSRSIEESFTVQRVLRPAGVEAKRITYLQLTEGILEMVKAGMGISVLPKWSIANAVGAGDVIALRINRTGVFRKWFAATLDGIPATPFMKDFIRLLTRQGPGAQASARRRPRLAS